MADLRNRSELKKWLENQPHEVGVMIAARAALRVLPLLAVEFAESEQNPERVASDIVLPVFRAVAVSWAASRYPGAGPEKRNAAARTMLASHAAAYGARFAPEATEAAADTVAVARAAAETTFAAAKAARDAATATAATVFSTSSDFAAEVSDAALTAAIAAGDAAEAENEADVWEAVNADMARIRNRIAPKKLAGEALWASETPDWVVNYQNELE